MPSLTPQDDLSARVAAELTPRLNEHAKRLTWDAHELAAHQRDRLRVLLAHAAEHSPFHARRLRGLDPARFELADLARLPVMTKAQMMAEFDDVVTDRRLNLRVVEDHLAAAADAPRLLFDEYVCLASGGSSGLRGVFVQTLSEYTDLIAALVRSGYARAVAAGGLPPEGLVSATIAATSPVHASGFFVAVATRPPVRMISVPATLALPDTVARLNAVQPPALLGYSAKLAELAREQLAGRLRIAPRSVSAGGGPVTPADAAVIERGFGVPVTNTFGCSEGLFGASEPGGSVLTFATDICLAEPVDDDNRPVPPGVPSAKVLLTRLSNLTQPLVRYELNDQFVRPEGTPEDGWLRASVQGRAEAEEAFHYSGVTVDWQVLETVTVETAVREFQVRQTPSGIDVTCASDRDLDAGDLAARLEAVLRRAGLTQPDVSVRQVQEIPRDAVSGKVRLFIPIEGD